MQEIVPWGPRTVKNYSLIDKLTKFLDFRYEILKQKILPPKKYPPQLSLSEIGVVKGYDNIWGVSF